MTASRGERLGSGAITETFVATSFGAEGFEKTVVEKRVHADLAAVPRFVDAFVAEAQRASALSHANVVLLMDVAKDEAGYRLMTEFVDGVDLARLVELSRSAGVALPEAIVAFIGAEIAKGLDYAHRRRGGAVVHGGLSPSNVIVSRDGAVKISDFGLHRAREDAGFAPDEVRARPFRSPERLGGGDATKAGDMFALGAILRELAKGGPPFEPAEALAAAEDARPTAGSFHERVLAWAYARGAMALRAGDLAKLVARLQRETPLTTIPAIVETALAPSEPAPEPHVGTSARTREVALLVVSDLAEATSASLVRSSIEAAGGVVTAMDGAELRAVFGLASEEGRDVRDALRAGLGLVAESPRIGLAVDVGRVLVDERGSVVEDAGSAARFARAALLASTAQGRVVVPAEVVRAASEAFAFSSEGGRAFVTEERPRPLSTSRFVGRRAELARLGAAWEACQGGPRVVAITGEAGVGKTRLALELERRVLLRDPSTRTRFLASIDDAWDPLDLVVIEASEAFAAPLSRARLRAREAGRRALFVVVARELGADLRAIADEEVQLGPLSDDEAVELAASLLGARVLVPDLLERLRDVAERTPLFLTETLRDWMDQAVVVVRDGVAVLHAGALAPPRTLRALVEGRLDRLRPEQLELVRALAIAGDEATREEVASMVSASESQRELPDLDPSLLAPGGRALRPLVRQVVLDTVPPDARRALHAAAERAITASPSAPAAGAKRAERIGHHRVESGDARGALTSFLHAAHGHARPADRARAAAQALRLLPPVREPVDPALLGDIPRLVGMLASAADPAGASEGWLDLARETFERIDRDGALADRVVVRLEAARLAVQLAAVPEARVALDQASNLAVDVRLRARVLATEMELALRTGEIGRGRDAASALFDLASTHPLREIESPAVLTDAAEIFGAARDERAAETALGLALDLGADGSPSIRAAIEARRARVELLLGAPGRALRTSMIAVDLADAAGATRLRAEAKLALAESSIHAGRLDRAHAALVAALEAAESSGHDRAATSSSALLIWLGAETDPAEAREKLASLASRCDARGLAADDLAIRLLAARLLDGPPARDALRAIEAAATRLGHAALAAEAAAAAASR